KPGMSIAYGWRGKAYLCNGAEADDGAAGALLQGGGGGSGDAGQDDRQELRSAEVHCRGRWSRLVVFVVNSGRWLRKADVGCDAKDPETRMLQTYIYTIRLILS